MPFIVAWSFQRIFTTGIHSRVFGSVKPSAPGWRYLDDSRGLKLLKYLSLVLTFQIFAWYTQYFHWQIFSPFQANAFLSKPHILNVFRSGHKSWMFVTEAVSGMMGFYPLEDPTQWYFFTQLSSDFELWGVLCCDAMAYKLDGNDSFQLEDDHLELFDMCRAWTSSA